MRDERKGIEMDTIRHCLELICCLCQSHIPYLPITPALLFQSLIEQEWIVLQSSSSSSASASSSSTTTWMDNLDDDQFIIYLNQEKIASSSDYLTFCRTLASPLLEACHFVTEYLVQYATTTTTTTSSGSGCSDRNTHKNDGVEVNTVVKVIMKMSKKKELIMPEGDSDQNKRKAPTVMTTQLLRNSIECMAMMKILKKCRKGKETLIQLDEGVIEREIKPLLTVQSILSIFLVYFL